MPYRLILDHDDGSKCSFFFEEEKTGPNGWGWLRLVRIEDTAADGEVSVTCYDPAVHDGGSHYMSHLWRARGRRNWLREGITSYSLVGAFGTPGHMMLDWVG